MSGVNKTILVGNVGKKPERRVTTSGQVVCNFSICVNERLGKEREKATWFNIVTFGNQAEACAQYLDKGRQVYVEGRIDVRTVEKDGVRRTFTDIVAHDIQFLSAPAPRHPMPIRACAARRWAQRRARRRARRRSWPAPPS